MKTFFSLIAGLIATTASFSSFAQTTPTPQMLVTVTDNKVRVLVGEEKTSALVTIMDEDGTLIYSDQANLKHGIRESLDLSQLPAGIYKLAVSAGDVLITKTILINQIPNHKEVALVDHLLNPNSI